MTDTNTAATNTAASVHELLNGLIGAYWSAYAQHHAHVALVRSLGLIKLADAMQQHIDDEPQTLRTLVERLVELDGRIDLDLSKPAIGSTLKEVLYNDLAAQKETRPALNRAAEMASAAHDATTRYLIESILRDEEEHLDWLSTEVDLYESLGEALYKANRLQ